jgi:hypothetical protein
LVHPCVAARLPGEALAEAAASGTLITIGSDATAVNDELVLAVRQALRDALSPIAFFDHARLVDLPELLITQDDRSCLR